MAILKMLPMRLNRLRFKSWLSRQKIGLLDYYLETRTTTGFVIIKTFREGLLIVVSAPSLLDYCKLHVSLLDLISKSAL